MRCVFFLVVLTGLLLSGGVLAHQQKEAYTSLAFNPRSGNVEIVHRFYIHDAEHAVKQIFGKHADLMAEPQTRGEFSAYVARHFALKNHQGEPIVLHTLGEELEGKFLWVYQELPNTSLEDLGYVDAQFLYEVWPRHRNIVNVEYPNQVKSLRLVKGDKWKQLPGQKQE